MASTDNQRLRQWASRAVTRQLTWLEAPTARSWQIKVIACCCQKLHIKTSGTIAIERDLASDGPTRMLSEKCILAVLCDAMACVVAGHSKPEQDVQDTAQSQGGASEAEKTEKKKAKKVRQRAARAQAAAQKAEVRH